MLESNYRRLQEKYGAGKSFMDKITRCRESILDIHDIFFSFCLKNNITFLHHRYGEMTKAPGIAIFIFLTLHSILFQNQVRILSAMFLWYSEK